MSKKIPDFTDNQIWAVESTLAERCQENRINQQCGTGINEYDEIEDCIISLLHVQADHTRDTRRESENAN